MRTLLLLLSAAHDAAFVLFREGGPLVRWNAPIDAFESGGLGRGLGYAIDPSFCRSLLPHMVDSRRGYWSVVCEDVESAVHRAFASWAANSPAISFVDMSHSCTASDCATAEVYLQPKVLTAPNASEPLVTVELRTSSATPRSTGVATQPGLPAQERTITKAIISLKVSPDVEWYLDASICRAMLSQTYDVPYMARVLSGFSIAFGIIAAIFLLRRSYQLHERILKEQHGSCSCLHGVLGFFEQVWALISVLALLVVPAVVTFGYLDPCESGVALEQALLHAVGASLGIGNVSAPNAVHLSLQPGPIHCSSARSVVVNSTFDPLASAAAEGGRCTEGTWWLCDNRDAAVMQGVRPASALNTLTRDDLEALNVLYPPYCNATRQTEPLDIPSASWHAGWTMIGTIVVPFALLAFLLPPCAACAKCAHSAFSPATAAEAGVEMDPEPVIEVEARAKSGREYRM